MDPKRERGTKHNGQSTQHIMLLICAFNENRRHQILYHNRNQIAIHRKNRKNADIRYYTTNEWWITFIHNFQMTSLMRQIVLQIMGVAPLHPYTKLTAKHNRRDQILKIITCVVRSIVFAHYN